MIDVLGIRVEIEEAKATIYDLKLEIKRACRKTRGGMFGNPGSRMMAYYSPLLAGIPLL